MERTSKQCKKFRLSHPNKVQSGKKKRNRKREIEKLRAAIRVENHRDKELVEVVNCSGLAWRSNSFDIYEKIKDNSNARDRSRLLLEWLISPISIERFFNEFWEKKALVIKRSDPNYYSHIFSSKEMDEILRKENIQYSVNLDVTEYVDGERRTLNPEGRAYPAVVWKYYEEGCSLRFLNPQTFSNSLWWLNATLQDFFHSFVGANMYLTPPNSQGFAPHYDDIEAFILQIEGEKHWKLHPPRNENEILARESSGELDTNTIS